MEEKERKGYTWKQISNGGFWVKDSNGARHSHTLDFFCPHCFRITGTIDDKYLESIGICAECYVMYVEDRKEPAIDLSKYKK